MKTVLISILLVIFCNAEFTDADINLKKLKKEIENRFQLTDFNLTEKKFPKASAKLNEHGIFWNIESKNEEIGFAYTGRVFSCCKNGCTAGQPSVPEEMAEFFDYFIIFDKSKTVVSVVVFNYEATHGQEVTAKGWLKQFAGYNGNRNLVVGKNIDAISGATVSVNAITDDITRTTSLLQSYN